MNASFYPEMTKMLKKIIDDISEKIIKEGTPIILVDEYSWYREVLSLMAKQINLCDSCLLLLENGMEQEAYLLARSQFNNMLWIKYLCNDDTENTRVKEYFYQPHINQILSCKNIKKMIKEYGTELDEQLVSEENIQKLNDCISENTQILEENSISIKPKSISELSRQDALLFGLYITLYNEGMKRETGQSISSQSRISCVRNMVFQSLMLMMAIRKKSMKAIRTGANIVKAVLCGQI